jgi:MerR family transcriptional regulator, thiopeptide resistance regulator
MEKHIAQSNGRVKNWSKADWEKSNAAFAAIGRAMAALIERAVPAGADEAQAVVRRHFEWLRQFWTPTRESYAGHGQIIMDSELRTAYEAFHPRLPKFMAEAVKVFAGQELT